MRAERMVERTEVVREARRVAEQAIAAGRGRRRRLRHEAEDYVDRKLAAFEVVLDRTMQTVEKGREQLQAVVEPLPTECPTTTPASRRCTTPTSPRSSTRTTANAGSGASAWSRP